MRPPLPPLPNRADASTPVVNRHVSRRDVVVGSAAAGLAAFFGGISLGTLPLGKGRAFGIVTAANAQAGTDATKAAIKQAVTQVLGMENKDPGLMLLNDRPLNAETPAHLLDDDFTPASRFLVRNNGRVPENVDASTWTLEVAGESVNAPKTFAIADLKKKFKHYTYALTLECGGNGRAEFSPGAKGNQWTTGAVGCAKFTGVRLKDVLHDVGIQKSAVYVGYYGADIHLSGDPNKVVISRGVPMAKALENEVLIAWEMNGEPIPRLHGGPLRLVVGGWPASVSGKWLKKLVVRDRIHDGPKMGGQSYRVPCKSVEAGATVPDSEMCIIESMPVKSVITSPQSGAAVKANAPVKIRGHAWAGDFKVDAVDVSLDYGATWTKAKVKPPLNRLAWQNFEATVTLPVDGYYEVWARARDSNGVSQPMVVPGWNPRGYLNNACHRIALRAVAG